jgi:hypothetical protein
MTQERKELIIETVELATSGMLNKHELITKLEAISLIAASYRCPRCSLRWDKSTHM